MNVLELKGSIIELIAKIDNSEILSRVHDFLVYLKDNPEEDDDKTTYWWDGLTSKQQADLIASIGETEDPKKWTAHEDVRKMSRQWLS